MEKLELFEEKILLWELEIQESDPFAQMLDKILARKNITWKSLPYITGLSRSSIYGYQKEEHIPSFFAVAIIVYGLKIDFITALALLRHAGYSINKSRECEISLKIMQSVPFSEIECSIIYKRFQKILDE